MKTVFSSSREIPHLWANQTQSHARAGNVSFEGRKFFSYGTVIAELCETRNGTLAAVFDSCRYSVSTSKHQGMARDAADHLLRYYIERGKRCQTSLQPVKSDVQNLIAKALAMLETSARGPVAIRPDKINRASSLFASAQVLAHEFKLGKPATPAALKPQALAKVLAEALKAAHEWRAAYDSPENVAKREKNRTARAKAKDAAKAEYLRLQDERNREHIEAWKRGEASYCKSSTVLLRLAKGEDAPTVETSQGARVRLSDALRLFRFCQRAKNSNQQYTPENGFGVGPYSLQMITSEGNARVGCHLLTFAEMERLFLTLSPSQIHEANTPSDLSLS